MREESLLLYTVAAFEFADMLVPQPSCKPKQHSPATATATPNPATTSRKVPDWGWSSVIETERLEGRDADQNKRCE